LNLSSKITRACRHEDKDLLIEGVQLALKKRSAGPGLLRRFLMSQDTNDVVVGVLT
jgi:hypothetical protein